MKLTEKEDKKRELSRIRNERYRKKHPERVKRHRASRTKEQRHEEYMRRREKAIAFSAAWGRKHPEKRKLYQQRDRAKVKRIVFDHYGAWCHCCDEKEYMFLCIDHIENGKGNPAKRVNQGIWYRWIIQNGFPDYLQVLCHNCNMAKGIFGQCPHKGILEPDNNSD